MDGRQQQKIEILIYIAPMYPSTILGWGRMLREQKGTSRILFPRLRVSSLTSIALCVFVCVPTHPYLSLCLCV